MIYVDWQEFMKIKTPIVKFGVDRIYNDICIDECAIIVGFVNEIDYDKMLAPTGLRLNKSNWKLEILPNLNPLQEKIHIDMFGR